MIVHNVFFWLRPDLTDDQKQQFRQGVEDLADVDTVNDLLVGECVPSKRSVVVSDYSFGLVVTFDDQQAADVYQDHPLHQEFIRQFSGMWTKVAVYDFETGD